MRKEPDVGGLVGRYPISRLFDKLGQSIRERKLGLPCPNSMSRDLRQEDCDLIADLEAVAQSVEQRTFNP
jgi:hypothetical protein